VNTHYAVIYFSGDPDAEHPDEELRGESPHIELIWAGSEDFCWRALADWTTRRPLRLWERAEVLARTHIEKGDPNMTDTETAWLESTYGNTSPPSPDWVMIQRDDESDLCPGDLEAAVLYANHHGGGEILAIGDGSHDDGSGSWEPLLADLTDVMVRLRPGKTHILWITVDEAKQRGILDESYVPDL
jgi:hypothetical protein